MKTKTGFEYEIPGERLDNMELLDALAEMEENELAISKVCRLLLGNELRKKLYDHVRTDDGRVPTEAVAEEVTDIILGLGKTGKN